MPSELVLVNAKAHTMVSADARAAEAIAIDGDRITAVGSRSEMEALIGSGTKVLDLGGKTVLPGFVDCHVHLMHTGLGLMAPDLRPCTSLEEIFGLLSDAVKTWRPGQPLWANACMPSRLKEGRMPTMAELDSVSREFAIFVVDSSIHGISANSKAWELMAIPPDTQGVGKTPDGKPNGVMVGRANTLAKKRLANMTDDSYRLEGLQRASRKALSVGITTLHALDGGLWCGDRDMEILLEQKRNIQVRFLPFYQTPDVQSVIDLGLPRIGGCLWVDGAPAQRTAAFFEPYSDDTTTKGVLYFTQEETDEFIWEAHKAGLHISRHAIGDAAIEQMIWACEKAHLKDPRSDTRYRIEHYSYPTEGQLERTARLGMVPIAAPLSPPSLDPAEYQRMLQNSARLVGQHRVKQRAPYRKMIDMGIQFAGGSDSDITPMNPLNGIQALAAAYEPERRITPFEAVRCFTSSAARAGREETEKGTIEAGRLADLVVLGADPMSVPVTTIKDIPVEKTILGGKIVYEK